MLDQIRRQVATGALGEGEQVPSVRQLAEQLAVNQNTVLKVYNQLCLEGILKVDRGNGTFVAPGAATASRAEGRQMVAQAVREVVTQAVQMGMGREEFADLVQQEYEAVQRLRPQAVGAKPPNNPVGGVPSVAETPAVRLAAGGSSRSGVPLPDPGREPSSRPAISSCRRQNGELGGIGDDPTVPRGGEQP